MKPNLYLVIEVPATLAKAASDPDAVSKGVLDSLKNAFGLGRKPAATTPRPAAAAPSAPKAPRLTGRAEDHATHAEGLTHRLQEGAGTQTDPKVHQAMTHLRDAHTSMHKARQAYDAGDHGQARAHLTNAETHLGHAGQAHAATAEHHGDMLRSRTTELKGALGTMSKAVAPSIAAMQRHGRAAGGDTGSPVAGSAKSSNIGDGKPAARVTAQGDTRNAVRTVLPGHPSDHEAHAQRLTTALHADPLDALGRGAVVTVRKAHDFLKSAHRAYNLGNDDQARAHLQNAEAHLREAGSMHAPTVEKYGQDAAKSAKVLRHALVVANPEFAKADQGPAEDDPRRWDGLIARLVRSS